jgi:uncharacterized protein YxeA
MARKRMSKKTKSIIIFIAVLAIIGSAAYVFRKQLLAAWDKYIVKKKKSTNSKKHGKRPNTWAEK